MKRRTFLVFLGGAAALSPVATRAQGSGVRTIGWLGYRSAKANVHRVAGFRKGLRETGYAEGRNVRIEFHSSGGQYQQLPAMAADLVRRRVDVIFASGVPAALAAKQATTAIPIVFSIASSGEESGLVTSLGRPYGNITGVTNVATERAAMRLDLLHDLLPRARTIAVLINPANPNSRTNPNAYQARAQARDVEMRLERASTDAELEAVFARAKQAGAALVIAPDGFFISRNEQIAALALRHAVPTIAPYREFAAAGGLMSYGADFAEQFRRAGVYVGRVLNGEKPASLPVIQVTRLELVLNLQTARALGIAIPPAFRSRVDHVIE